MRKDSAERGTSLCPIRVWPRSGQARSAIGNLAMAAAEHPWHPSARSPGGRPHGTVGRRRWRAGDLADAGILTDVRIDTPTGYAGPTPLRRLRAPATRAGPSAPASDGLRAPQAGHTRQSAVRVRGEPG